MQPALLATVICWLVLTCHEHKHTDLFLRGCAPESLYFMYFSEVSETNLGWLGLHCVWLSHSLQINKLKNVALYLTQICCDTSLIFMFALFIRIRCIVWTDYFKSMGYFDTVHLLFIICDLWLVTWVYSSEYFSWVFFSILTGCLKLLRTGKDWVSKSD